MWSHVGSEQLGRLIELPCSSAVVARVYIKFIIISYDIISCVYIISYGTLLNVG